MSEIYDNLSALKLAAESMPSPDKIGGVLALLSKGAPYEQLFFEKLNDQSWLPVLDRCGFFSNLPEAKRTVSGALQYPFHIPLFGLARLAPIAPQAVTGILAQLEIPDNPTVGDQILRCISSIREPSCIPVLHGLLVRLSEKPNASSWVWIHELLKNWIEIKAFQDVLIVVNSFLLASASASANASPLHDIWLIKQVDEIVLAPLTAVYPMPIATILFNALTRLGETKGSTGPKTEVFDVITYFGESSSAAYWLEDFKSESSYRETEGKLAPRVYLAAQQIYNNGNVVEIELLDQLLRANSLKLFHRLRWQLYADYPTLSFERARKDVVERISFLNRFELEHCYEFAQLLQIHAKQYGESFLSAQNVEQFFDVVMSGPVEKIGRAHV